MAADGLLADKDTRANNWYLRVADLSAYAGMSVFSLNLYNNSGGASGGWDIFFGDISLVRQDGTVIPIYHRTMTSLSQFTPGAAESNVSVITDKWFNEPTTLVYPTYYSGDQIGSTRVLTSGGGWPMSSETYYPFGQEQGATTDPNHYKFTGFERDSESGLDHATFRQHSSSAGRWMSPDPYLGRMDLANPQTFNRYSYVNNNPLRYIDPSGLCGYWSRATDVFTNIDGTVTTSPPISTYVGDDNCGYSYYEGFSGGSGYSGGSGDGGGPNAPSNCAQTPPGTPSQYCAPLQQGLAAAKKALQKKGCSAFYGGQGAQTLDATTYRFLDMGSPTTGAATIDPNNVFVNSNGPYMNYTPTPGQAGPFGRYWTQSQFRGFILLHELGHQLSPITGFGPDAGSPRTKPNPVGYCPTASRGGSRCY